MNVLIGFERSQVICKEFRNLGYKAYSCDIEDSYGDFPQYHLKMDFFKAVDFNNWDLCIMHPPCTHLSVSGAGKFKEKQKDGRQKNAINFFLKCTKIGVKHWAIENPIGIMSTLYKKPNQIIQPYQYGHKESKSTCLWLHNLPPLIPTKKVFLRNKKEVFENQTKNKQNQILVDGKHLKYKDPLVAIIRSQTYVGIAKAMAEQWSAAVNNKYTSLHTFL